MIARMSTIVVNAYCTGNQDTSEALHSLTKLPRRDKCEYPFIDIYDTSTVGSVYKFVKFKRNNNHAKTSWQG